MIDNRIYLSLYFFTLKRFQENFPGGVVNKNLPTTAGDMVSIPGSGRSPGGGNGNPLHYSYLKNPMARGAWQATVHAVSKTWT